MAIVEENGNPLLGDSLASQLEQAANQESITPPPPANNVAAHQKIEAGWQNTIDLLDDSKS